MESSATSYLFQSPVSVSSATGLACGEPWCQLCTHWHLGTGPWCPIPNSPGHTGGFGALKPFDALEKEILIQDPQPDQFGWSPNDSVARQELQAAKMDQPRVGTLPSPHVFPCLCHIHSYRGETPPKGRTRLCTVTRNL